MLSERKSRSAISRSVSPLAMSWSTSISRSLRGSTIMEYGSACSAMSINDRFAYRNLRLCAVDQSAIRVVLPKPVGAEVRASLPFSPWLSLSMRCGRGTRDGRSLGVYNFVRRSVSVTPPFYRDVRTGGTAVSPHHDPRYQTNHQQTQCRRQPPFRTNQAGKQYLKAIFPILGGTEQ